MHKLPKIAFGSMKDRGNDVGLNLKLVRDRKFVIDGRRPRDQLTDAPLGLYQPGVAERQRAAVFGCDRLTVRA